MAYYKTFLLLGTARPTFRFPCDEHRHDIDRAGHRHSPVDLSVSWLSLLPNPVIESEIQMLRKLEDYFVPYV